jgi:serine/threonine-protein kinase
MLRAILNKPIPSPLHYSHSIDPELSAIAERALQRNPERRFKSAGEMGANIRDVLRKEGAAAGVADVAAYTKKVLAGRERTKKAILRALQKEGNMPFPLQILKPEKAESSDTSLSSELSAEGEDEHPSTQAESPLGRRLGWGAPTPSGGQPVRPFQTRIWIIIPALILGIVIGGWWVASMSDDPDETSKEVTSDPKHETASVTPPAQPTPREPEPAKPKSVDAGQPVAVKVEPPDERPKRPVRKRRRIRRRPRKKADGFLRLDTSPWSIVYLGKRKLGLTPLVGVKLPAGTHKLTAVNDERDLKKTIQVTITPGKTTMLQVKLR